MDMTTLSQLIGSLVFPIFCCVAMFYMLNEEHKEHKSETLSLLQAINNNTIALEKLIDKLEIK